jgi:glycosyltransferase involved in cell wall biosynthesis
MRTNGYRKYSMKNGSGTSVLLVINLVPNKMGAYEKFMMAFADRCSRDTIRLDFMLPGEPLPEIREALCRAGCKLHILPDWNTGSSSEIKDRFVKRYIDIIASHYYDIVSFSFCEEIPVLASLLQTRVRLPLQPAKRTIWHQHSQQQKPGSILSKYLSQLRLLSCGLNKICPVYAHAGAIMRERSISADKIHVLYNGVMPVSVGDEERRQKRQELGVTPDDFILFSASSLIARKNVAMSIRAVAKSLPTCPSLHLFVAGDGEDKENLGVLAENLNISPRIHLLGRRSDVPQIIAAADLCVLTSFNEAFPFFCAESYGQKKAMICTPAGGIPEILQDGVQGAIVPFDDVNALVAAICRFVSDAQYRQSCEAAAYETFCKQLTLDVMVDEYFRCYFH